MKKIFVSFCQIFFLLTSFWAYASDTITIRTIEFNQPKYGWFDFPDSTQTFEKILMNYTIKCPCGEWDYIANVFVKQFYVPNFRVDSSVVEEFALRFDTSWVYSLSNVGGQLRIDSTPAKPKLVEFYEDENNPSNRTSFRYVWQPYYRYYINSFGQVDSVFVPADTVLQLKKRRVYYNDELTISDTYEIMRFITPYGIGLDVGDGFTWVLDVSDFRPLLTGRVYIDAPNQQEPIEITFDFIKGIPERKVLRIEKLWEFNRLVYDKNTENYLSPRIISLNPNEKMARFKVIQTGHGFGGNEDNCCEFCRKNAFVKINDTIRYTRPVWRICSDNPLYPQGGTWLFDRSNWCPGAIVHPFDFELTPFIKSTSFLLDYDMEFYDKPYASGSNTVGNWVITSYLIVYDSLNFRLDAEITDIVRPSNKDVHLRFNPASTNPIIYVRNRGSQGINNLDFEYGIINGNVYTYNWVGEIKPLEEQRIILPSINCDEWEINSNKFFVRITKVNGIFDDYQRNNFAISEFSSPPSYYQNLVINLRTNNYDVLPFYDGVVRPYSYELFSADGKQVFAKNELLPSTYYRDTLNLQNGCYEFVFNNLFNCGLGFWFYQRYYNLSNGSLEFASDNLLEHRFQLDFGSQIRHSFRVDFQPTVSFYPDTLDFGSVEIGKSKVLNVIVKPSNLKGLVVKDPKIPFGTQKGLKIEKIMPEPDNLGNINLSSSDSATIVISFQPSKEGKITGTLSFLTNDKKQPSSSVPIIGFGKNPNSVGTMTIEEGVNLYYKNHSKCIVILVENDLLNIYKVDVFSVLGDLVYSIAEPKENCGVICLPIFLANGAYYVKIDLGNVVVAKPLLVFDF